MTEIFLSDNYIRDDGAKALAEVRSKCPYKYSLETLNGSPYAFILCLLMHDGKVFDFEALLAVLCSVVLDRC